MIDHYDGYKRIQNMKPALEEWVREFSGELTDDKEFITDVQRQLLTFVSSVDHYITAKDAIANHKEKDYLKELEEAIESCEKIADNLRDFRNPIFSEDSESEVIKNWKKIIDVNQYLQKKRTHILEEEQKENQILLEKCRTKLDLLAHVKRGLEVVEGKEFYKYLHEDEQKVFIGLAAWTLEPGFDSVNENDFSNQYNAYKTKKKSEIRRRLILDLASIYITYTNRTTLKRTSGEIAMKKKSPFKELLIICFNKMDDRVTKGALNKLLADVNTSFSKLLIDLNIEEK